MKKLAKRGRPTIKKTKLANSTQKSTLAKARANLKIMRAKLANLKAEFKQKLEIATTAAYEKALNDAMKLQEKKAEAKKQMLAKAEEKFEKKFSKKTKAKSKTKSSKKSKTMAKPKMRKITSMTRKSRRGRPRKVA